MDHSLILILFLVHFNTMDHYLILTSISIKNLCWLLKSSIFDVIGSISTQSSSKINNNYILKSFEK